MPLGVTSGWASYLAPRLAPALAEGVRVAMHAAAPPVLLDMLASGRLHLVVTVAQIPHKAVVYEELFNSPMVLACAAARGAGIAGDSPPDLPLIDLQGPLSGLQAFWAGCYNQPAPAPALVVPDHAAALAAVRAGAGIAVLPRALCAEAAQRGEIAFLHAPANAPSTQLLLARSRPVRAPGSRCKSRRC